MSGSVRPPQPGSEASALLRTPIREPAASSTTATTQAPPALGQSVAGAADSAVGEILIDGDGNALYLFTPDESGPSVCNDDCVAAWPPVLGAATAGPGTDADLLGTAARDDGATQATYNQLLAARLLCQSRRPRRIGASPRKPSRRHSFRYGGRRIASTPNAIQRRGSMRSPGGPRGMYTGASGDIKAAIHSMRTWPYSRRHSSKLGSFGSPARPCTSRRGRLPRPATWSCGSALRAATTRDRGSLWSRSTRARACRDSTCWTRGADTGSMGSIARRRDTSARYSRCGRRVTGSCGSPGFRRPRRHRQPDEPRAG